MRIRDWSSDVFSSDLAAWKLVAYLSDPKVQARFHGMTGNLPPRRSPWEDPALANDPYARAFRDQLERAVSTPKVPEWERIATELKRTGRAAGRKEGVRKVKLRVARDN